MLLVHSYTFVSCFVITVTKKYTNTTAVIFESAPLCFTPRKLYSVYLSCTNAISCSRCINKLHGFSKKNNQSKIQSTALKTLLCVRKVRKGTSDLMITFMAAE